MCVRTITYVRVSVCVSVLLISVCASVYDYICMYVHSIYSICVWCVYDNICMGERVCVGVFSPQDFLPPIKSVPTSKMAWRLKTLDDGWCRILLSIEFQTE